MLWVPCVVFVDELPEALGQVQPGRVLADGVVEPLLKILLDGLGDGALVGGEAQGELLEVNLVEVDQRVGSIGGADDVLLGPD